ncbi:hypothetical protein ACTFIW_002801 [Dictyostelium discoideum]
MRKDFLIMKDLSEESNPNNYQELEKLGISYKPALKVDGVVFQPKESQLSNPTVHHPVKFIKVSRLVAFKGSINPTHYHVLLDEHQMAADLFQFFTFQMGHLYFDLKNLLIIIII